MLSETYIPELRLNVARGPANGPPLVLLHGVLRNHRDFAPLLPWLLVHFEVIAPDFRGHGGSDPADSYLVTDYVEDAAKLLRWLDRPAFVFGHSLGGMVAAAVAAQEPRVRGIVLEDPPFHTMGDRIRTTPLHNYFKEVAEVANRGGHLEELTAGLAATRFGDGRRLADVRDAVAIKFAGACLSRVDPAVLTPIVRGEWLTGYEMPRVGCETLILQGDPVAGGMLTDADAAGFEGAVVLKFAGAGHLLHWTRTQDVANHTLAFLAAL
jgi:pimeloyl-ACP methyl ester carboxylesterase